MKISQCCDPEYLLSNNEKSNVTFPALEVSSRNSYLIHLHVRLKE